MKIIKVIKSSSIDILMDKYSNKPLNECYIELVVDVYEWAKLNNYEIDNIIHIPLNSNSFELVICYFEN